MEAIKMQDKISDYILSIHLIKIMYKVLYSFFTTNFQSLL